MTDLLRLVRAHNLLIAAAGICAGGCIALGRLTVPASVAWAALSGVGLGAAGNVINDVLDVAADVANLRRDRPLAGRRIALRTALACLAAGAVIGVGSAALAGRAVLAVGVAALAVMVAYSPVLKPVPFVGNVAAAAVAGLPLMYGALAARRPAAGVVPWVLAGGIHLVREIVKDIDDLDGDRLAGKRTLPVLLGPGAAAIVAGVLALAFVAVSFILPRAADYGGAYFVIALPAQMAVMIAASRLFVGQIERVSALLKAAMVVGILALVAGKVA